MKKTLLLAFVFIANIVCFTQTYAQMGWKWGVESRGGAAYGQAMALDNAGNVFAAGPYVSPDYITFGTDTLVASLYDASTSNYAIFVTKADSSGHFLWVRGTTNTNAIAIDMDTDPAGNVYVLGMYWDTFCTIGSITIADTTPQAWYELFVSKFSPSGDIIWMKNIAPLDDYFNTFGITDYAAIATDGTGNVYVTGPFNFATVTIGTTTLVNTNSLNHAADILLAKFDTYGSAVWAKSFGTDSMDYPIDFDVTKTGNIYVTGQYFADSMTIGGTTIYGADTSSTSWENNFLAKFDPSGNTTWAKSLPIPIQPGGITTDNHENVYITGIIEADTFVFGSSTLYGEGLFDAFWAKFDSSGNPMFGALAGGNDIDIGYTISVDSIGNIWMCGEFGETMAPGYTMYFGTNSITYTWSTITDPMFMAEYDPSGAFITAMGLPSGGENMATIVADNRGSVYVSSGMLVDTMVFGPDTLTGHGQFSAGLFIAKYRYDTNRCDFMPAPVASFTYTGTYTDTFTYTGTAPYDSVRWYFGDGGTSTLANPVHTYAPGGSYNACVTVYTGCSSDGTGVTYCFLVDVPSGVANITAPHDVVIYPNPATAKLTICSGEQISSVVITDLLGQVVCSKLTTPRPLLKTGGEVISVDVSGLAAGIYFVKVDNTVVGKFVKE